MTIKIFTGDCRDVLQTIPDESVHCVVTSPPYWGLRDYGTAVWKGGDPKCDHRSPTMRDGRNEDRPMLSGSNASNSYQLILAANTQCGKCGATRVDSQIGLERSLGKYIETMVAVFREVHRVLRKDGTLWLNLGDSYAASVNGRSAADVKALGNDDRTFRDKPFSTIGPIYVSEGQVPDNKNLKARVGQSGNKDNGASDFGGRIKAGGIIKPKDLCGIPWRVAFALQEDGWYLRQDIIWSKPNPMPESVRDRCTKAHEYVFLLSKSERYYYDAEAIREPQSEGTHERFGKDPRPSTKRKLSEPGSGVKNNSSFDAAMVTMIQPDGCRNKRSVWEITTSPFPEAHFATFPPALIEPCILAGCPKGGTVLDPFGGAGTTGLVADRLERNSILIELNPEYVKIAENRLRQDAGMFLDLQHAQCS